MTPCQAQQIFRDLIGNEADFRLFLDHFQRENLLLPAAAHNRPAREILGKDPVTAVMQAERSFRRRVSLFSSTSPTEAAEKSTLAPDSEDGFLANCMAEGFTARFADPDTAFPRLALVLRAFVLLFPKKETHTTMFWSPGNVQGANLHFDDMEVLALQLSGTKTWQVETGRTDHPNTWWLSRFHDRPPDIEYRTYNLGEGDLLYIPAGRWHRAIAGTEGSIHVTIAFRPMTIRDGIRALLDDFSDRNIDLRLPIFGLTDPRSRAWDLESSQPLWDDAPAKVIEELGELPSAALADPSVVHQALVMQRAGFILKLSPLPPVEVVGEISAATPLRLREMAIGEVIVSDDSAVLYYPNGRMTGPRQIAAALRHILTHERFAPDELPGPLTQKSKIALARQLMRHGVLEMADTATPEDAAA